MNGRTTLLAVVLAASSLAPLALAGEREAPYYAFVPYGGAGVQCNTACLPAGPELNLGGYRFPPDDRTPIAVVVTDDFSESLYVTACQDSDGDGFCGETGEPEAAACGTRVDLKGFAASLDTLVYVYSTDAFGECVGQALKGTITLVTQ